MNNFLRAVGKVLLAILLAIPFVIWFIVLLRSVGYLPL